MLFKTQYVYTKNFVSKLLNLAETCIPNKVVTIRPTDPPWITSAIKKHIRKRKRAYRKAKRTNLSSDWTRFKKLRNEIVSMIRKSKQSLNENLATKLRSSRQWWTILK